MIAAVIIAGGKRRKLIADQILPSVADFDEVLVVGQHYEGKGYRYLCVPDMTKSTNDALVKRDVGALATKADVICYLSDDHCVAPGFVGELRTLIDEAFMPWDVLIPSRWAEHPEEGRVRIPNGEVERYCAGHGGVFRRRVIEARPWAAHRHHRNWDLIASHDMMRAGFQFVSYPRLEIQDLEPEAQPWR